ncbi:enoyl-CoA hydratase/isomerase family protein [Rhodococcus koreensis]|uniref:enoyl-CoA hydratase/isomerase family protein n=1 Tax=Rhodococcus koreensis TaxID=99653 RepID=UPI00366B7E19
MSEALVVRTDSDHVATLTINRPDKLNALNHAVFVELRAHLETIAGDDGVGCVVLTGAGRSFCAGHDLSSIDSSVEADGSIPTEDFEPATLDLLESLPKPTIARITGHCYTGGLELALACDLLVAGASARMGDTHGQWGLVPAWGMSVRLPERVGYSTAKKLMFTSRRITSDVALSIGLVDEMVADEDLDATVAALAAEIVANSWGTNRIDKQLLASARTMPRDTALMRERTFPFGIPTDMTERMARSSS